MSYLYVECSGLSYIDTSYKQTNKKNQLKVHPGKEEKNQSYVSFVQLLTGERTINIMMKQCVPS